MDPVTDQDLPQPDLIENEDGSVDIPDELVPEPSTEFQFNLAEEILETELTTLASELLEDILRDKQSRDKRDKQYEEGLRRTGLGDDAPGGAEFSGASDVVHPVLAEACVDFAARAIKELFPPQGPVKTSVIGKANEAQLDRAERKRTYMNWQLTTQMPEYRSELEQLLTQLPLGGSQFQKFWYDERFKRPISEFIPIDDILLPYSATSFYTAQRVTHVQHINQFEFDRRVKSGLYRKCDVLSAPGSLPERTASAEANDKIEGKEEEAYNEDGLRDIYEIYCWSLLDDFMVEEGEYAPYIVTIDAHSEKVLAIYRNWTEGDLTLEKLDWMVEWKFIPWRGAYAIGFPQLIGSLAAAATGALRALLDAAHINNSQTLVKLKSGRLVGQNITIDTTGITDIECPPNVDDIRKLLMAMPFNPPSPILFQLLGWLTDAAKNVVSTTEDAIAKAGDRTPVGTTQAMIEQGSAIYSAIHARLHESQKKSLQILCRINGTWLDDEQEVEDLGKLIIRREDFKGSLDVIPVSDPAIFSEAQRYAQNQALQQMQAQDAQDPSVPWNKIAIRRRVLKQMKIDDIDEVLPLPPKPLTSDPMTENMGIMHGQQCIANPQQDHMAHIQGHLTYLNSPLILQNPLIPGPPLMVLLQHVQQHILLAQQRAVTMTAQKILQMQPQMPPDAAMAAAITETEQSTVSTFIPVMQSLTQIFQAVQAKMPQPQMPPEVQASLQIAKMDNERRAALDKATIELKGAQQKADQAAEGAKLQMGQMQSQFDQWLSKQQLMLDDQNNTLTAQVDLMNNKADNTQKQMTELLKNRGDNDTAIQTKLMELQESVKTLATPEPVASPQPDFSPVMKEMQTMLSQIEKAKTTDALQATVEGLRTVMTTLAAPTETELIRGPDGKAQGTRSHRRLS